MKNVAMYFLSIRTPQIIGTVVILLFFLEKLQETYHKLAVMYALLQVSHYYNPSALSRRKRGLGGLRLSSFLSGSTLVVGVRTRHAMAPCPGLLHITHLCVNLHISVR